MPKDPHEFLQEGGDFQKAIDGAILPVDFLIDHADLSEKDKLFDTIMKYIHRMSPEQIDSRIDKIHKLFI